VAKEKRKLKLSVFVETTPELAFESVTQASELREWFSDQAWTQVEPGGRYAVRWNQGYMVEGTFKTLDPPHKAAVTWRGTGDPGKTTVKFRVKARDDGGAKVTVIHSGFGAGKKWDRAVQEAEKGWKLGLENLQSTAKTGVDQRIARQPFLGIYPSVLNAEQAAKEGIAVEEGIYVNGTLDDSGARAAGLDKGDVIVAISGAATPSFQALNDAVRPHRAGDVVDVELVRGQELETVQLTLGKRPMPDVPDTAEGLAQLIADQYKDTDAEVRAAVEGLTEEEAEQCPAEDEWSVKQVLAHLSVVERDTQSNVSAAALYGWQDGGAGNPTVTPGRLAAVLAMEPSLEGLLERYFADERETVELVRGLPEETPAHKARYHRIGQGLIFLPLHTRGHIAQIQDIVKAVRG
jgi:uncharacterized protein YndB with AHSA1/START domain